MSTEDCGDDPERDISSDPADGNGEAIHWFMIMLTLIGACVLGMMVWEFGSTMFSCCEAVRRQGKTGNQESTQPERQYISHKEWLSALRHDGFRRST